jgi:hypothetical protein
VALLWLADSVNTPTAVAALEAASPVTDNIAGIGEIYSGPSIGLYWNIGDSRTPDILVTPNIGVTYSNSKKKLAEHGGFAHDDVNVMLLLSIPHLGPRIVQSSAVETRQIAPTILQTLGFNASALDAVRLEGTRGLPGLY